MNPYERLMERVERIPFSDCWYVFATGKDGYPTINIGGKTFRANRFVFEQKEPLNGRHVRHTCDQPCCVNPRHLIAGTHQDNMKDRQHRDRQAKGVKHGRAKLTEADVSIIRSTYVKGSTNFGLVALARRFGISHFAIRQIVIGKRYI